MHRATPGEGRENAPEGPRSTPPGQSRPDLPATAQPLAAAPESDPQAGAGAEGPQPETDTRPRPLGPAVRPTGHAAVDARLRRLADADHLDVSGHPAVYEDVHRGLRSALTALDSHEPGS